MFYTNFEVKGLELMSKIVVYPKRRKERGWRKLIGYSQDQSKNNLNLRMSFFRPEKIDARGF